MYKLAYTVFNSNAYQKYGVEHSFDVDKKSDHGFKAE